MQLELIKALGMYFRCFPCSVFKITICDLKHSSFVSRNIKSSGNRSILAEEEFDELKANLIFQNGRSSWGGNRKLPYASRMQLELINLSTRKTLCSKSHGMSFQDAKLTSWTKNAVTISNICHLPLLNWELLSFKCILNLFDKTYEKYVLYISYISLYANVIRSASLWSLDHNTKSACGGLNLFNQVMKNSSFFQE